MTPSRIKKKRFQKFTVFLTFLLLSVGLLSAVTAFGSETQSGSFTLTLQETQEDGSHKVLPDVRLKLYAVGTMRDDNGAIAFVLDAALASTGIDLGKLTTASAIADAAEKLAGAVGDSGISPLESVTDADGIAVFSGLDTGMYLIIHSKPDSKLLVMPTLLSIPYVQESGNLLYDVQAFPKTIEPEPTTPPVPTDAPDITGSPAPTETPITGSPAPTEAPIISGSPVPTETPIITGSPAPTEAPVITESPTPTEAPITGSPAPTEAPITGSPAPTEAPIISGSPAPTEAPVTGAPAPTEQPIQSLTPEPTSDPNLPSDINTPDSPNDTASPENQVSHAVKTGDETPVTFYILLLITAGLLIGITIKQKNTRAE